MSQPSALPVEEIQRRIHHVRGHRVMLDADLARFYGVSSRRLLEQVRRNDQRFPGNFCFQLNRPEVANLRSQFAASSLGHGGRRYAPWAFTEHGALMAANVLNSPAAARMSVSIIRAFVLLRELLSNHRELAAKFTELERKLEGHDVAIANLFEAIRQLLRPPVPNMTARSASIAAAAERRISTRRARSVWLCAGPPRRRRLAQGSCVRRVR
ncbi:MAG TPA: ORF6N domain-containing protein [Opitutaceae bacterium]|nr:ORF6N domain-containing protein [Opitutaceae bacterium]